MIVAACRWKTLLSDGRARLDRAGISEAENKLRWVAAHLLGCGLLDSLRHLDETPSPDLAQAFAAAVARLATDEPVQYVIGETDFMGVKIRCDARALIPRPETEVLVGCAEDFLRGKENPVVVDVCTGTGCIALSLASEIPGAKLIGLDTSDEALALAQENAAALGLAERVVFLNPAAVDLADVLEPGSIDAVVANPPYIPTDACARLADNVRRFEPMAALDGGPDGMEITRQIIEESTMLLASGGFIFLEIGAEDDQARPLGRYLADVGFEGVRAHRDLFGKERFLSGVLASGL